MENSWHLSKAIPIGLIIGVVTQFAALVGLYYKVDNRILNIEKWQIQTQENRFTVSDGTLLSFKVGELKILLNEDLKSIKNSIISISDKQNKQASDMAVIKTILQYSEGKEAFSYQ